MALMTAKMTHPVVREIESHFGEGREWTAQPGFTATVWETPAYQLLWTDSRSETDLRMLWEARQGRRGWVVVLLGASSDPGRVQVVGPQSARPVRELLIGHVWRLLQKSRDDAPRDAASLLASEFGRLEESAVPGIRVKDLLTPHFVQDRLRRSENQRHLADAVAGVELSGDLTWRSPFERFGYRIQQLPQRGYLLRHDDAPVAVVHPHRSPSLFSRLTRNGELPEGLALADCRHHNARWAILASGGRYRLFSSRPPVGPASGQYIELDADDLERENRFYLGLLSPESLREGGWLTKWIEEAKDFGEKLRKGLEERLIKDVLPRIARGLGEHLESQGADLSDSEQLRRIEEAALTLVFRFMFLLHTEARGHLPIGSAVYRPHSARRLAEDSLEARSQLSPRSTQRWDRLRTLVHMVRNGDPSVGVPVYNGSLFAPDGFPGGDLLERAEITDTLLGPALAAIAYETLEPNQPGLDYAGLQIGHLGAIYEALLALRLTQAPEDLIYDDKAKDEKKRVFRPVRAGEQPEVTKAQLYYQSEAGGRKAGGVFYTRHEFVRHLLDHSLEPALKEHLDGLHTMAKRNPDEAARRLFDFSVVDPAMGSAHFLTAALDMMADRIETFLAEVGGLPDIAKMLSELTQDAKWATQPPEDGDLLRRLILKRCIYGVDLSPMAVEVANITLWLASFVPGLALSYLGSNLKCGNALIGVADPAIVDSPLLTGKTVNAAIDRAVELQHELAENPDRTPEEVKRSEELDAELREATVGLRRAFDLWAAEPLGVDRARHKLETNLSLIVENNGERTTEITTKIDEAKQIAERFSFFHWPLEFPNVFHRDRPGFDVVVGNPPWNKVKFETPSFLAIHDPGIRGLRSGLERDERAERLFQKRPELRQEMEDAKRQAEEERKFFKPENGYTIQGRGDADLYKLFCERYASILRSQGFMGVVLPRGAFLNDGSRGFRRWLFKKCRPSRIDTLLNNKRWAFDIHPQYTIALVTAQRGVVTEGLMTVTGPAHNKLEFTDRIVDVGVQIDLKNLAAWTPAPANDSEKAPTWELPLLPTQQHADILGKLRLGVRFDRLPLEGSDQKGPSASPHLALYMELHEAKQRGLFTHPPGDDRVPVWKGRSFDQYEPYGEPAGFCTWTDTLDFVQTKRERSSLFKRMFPATFLCDLDTNPIQHCRVAFRDVTNRTNSRTVIACLVPPRTPLTDTAPYIVFSNWRVLYQAGVLAVLNSIPFDWLARRYAESHLKYFILNSLTFPPPGNTPWEQIGSLAARLSCVDDRFADFAAEAEVECGPLTEAKRDDMRAEIDALVARAYGLTADELSFVFTDFTEKAVSTVYRERVLNKFESL